MDTRFKFWCFVLPKTLIMFYSTVRCDDNTLKFLKYTDSPARLSHRFKKAENITLLACSWYCHHKSSGQCLAINYNEHEHECEFNDKNMYFSDHILVKDEGWDVYNVVYDCGDPPEISRATGSWELTTTGSVARYSCNDGYMPANEEMIMSTMCNRGRRWNEMDLVCIGCGDPPTVPHATAFLESTSLGFTATYQCDDGYYPEDNLMGTSIICDQNEMWGTVELVCTGCGKPPKIPHANANWEAENITPGTTATYRCDMGYYPENGVETTTITCLDIMQWTDVDLVCTGCGPPSWVYITDATCLWSEAMIGSTAGCTCNAGYSTADGLTSMTTECLDIGQWSEINLVCQAIPTMFGPCVEDSDCFEDNSRCVDSGDNDIGKRCHCKPLFEYEESERTCKQVCEGYDITFTAYEGHYINAYIVPTGLTSNEGVSLEDCTSLCAANPECLSFDFVDTILWCLPNSLSKKQAIDAGVYADGDGSTSLYERNCLPEMVNMGDTKGD